MATATALASSATVGSSISAPSAATAQAHVPSMPRSGTPAWMSALMRLFGTFMSKKMMKRMVLLKKDWGRAAEVCGGVEFVPTGYGECGGTLTADPVLDPLFGRVSR